MTKNVSKYYNNFNNFIKIGKVEVKNILKPLVVTRFARSQKANNIKYHKKRGMFDAYCRIR